jgi:hypothetical protein
MLLNVSPAVQACNQAPSGAVLPSEIGKRQGNTMKVCALLHHADLLHT